MLLDYKNKFQTTKFSTISSHGTESAPNIKESVFQKWGNFNMYRTSYNDMSNRVG